MGSGDLKIKSKIPGLINPGMSEPLFILSTLSHTSFSSSQHSCFRGDLGPQSASRPLYKLVLLRILFPIPLLLKFLFIIQVSA